jgi:hypothetical protein
METPTKMRRKLSIRQAGYSPLSPPSNGLSSAPSRRLLSILIVALLVLPSCADFGPVKDYAALSKQASAGYSGIIDDMYQSCLRSAEFDPPSNADTPEKHCVEWKEIQPGLLHVESTLQDYLVAVGKLAGNETISYDKNLDSLRNEVEDIKLSGKSVFGSKQVDAIAGLAGFLLKAATDGYRQRQLERTFSAQNENVKTLTAALKDIIAHDYEKRLENEEIAIEAFRVRLHRASDQSLAVEIGMRQVQEHLWDIEKRKEAAENYVKTLDLIAKGHQQLFEHKKDLGSKELSKLLWDDASEMIPLIHGIQKAF